MSEITKISKEENFVYVQFGGSYSQMRDMEQVIEKLRVVCEAHQCHKVLIDARGIEGQEKMSTAEEQKLGNFFGKVLSYQYQIVLLHRTLGTDKGPVVGQYIETVAFNRGMRVRVMSDYDEAVAWLNE